MPGKLKFNPRQLTEEGKSFALWKLPHSSTAQAITGTDIIPFSPEFITNDKKGFAFVPFHNGEALFLSGDIYNELELTEITTTDDYFSTDTAITFETEEHYCKNVANGVAAIQTGAMNKVVLARNTRWEVPEGFCPLQFFKRLTQAYPEAFVSLVSIKGIGTWIGATPELLLRVTPESLSTVALAGTTVQGGDQWGQKESEEQNWVVLYIKELLFDFGVNEINIAPRKMIQNGPLGHLYTEISFKKSGIKHNELAARLLPHLHPTPAVGGLPAKPALDFILENENFDRSYYSGYLGPVNIDNETRFFVNLRCMQLTKNGLVAYAGAGITKDSIPEKELLETENKLNNLRSCL